MNTPPTEPLVFPQTLEGLFVRGLAGRLTPEIKDRLRAIGLDLDRPLRPAYPASVLIDGTELVARAVYPDKPIREAYFLLGERAVFGMEETLVGKAQIAFARLVGPMRGMMSVPKHVKWGSNYATATMVQESPTCVLNEVRGYKLPYAEFQEGNLTAAITICGGKEPKAETVLFDPKQELIRVRVSWK